MKHSRSITLILALVLAFFPFSVSANANNSIVSSTSFDMSYVENAIDSMIDIDHLKQIAQMRDICFSPTSYNVKVTAIQGDRNDATYGPSIQDAMSTWSFDHGAVAANGWQETLPAIIDLVPTAAKIYDLIDDDRPVALVGKTPSASELTLSSTVKLSNTSSARGSINHVITITGVQKIDSDYYFFAHFGWGTAYNDVYVSNSSLTKGAAVYY